MQGEAAITFTQPGVHPPVFVVTSLSTPPWEPLELKPSKEKTPSGDLIFEQKFGNVAEGSYQYKIRIGEGHWVVDESKESAADEHGNRNNVVHVRSAKSNATLDCTATAKDTLDRKDSALDTSGMNPVPIPFVVVEKVTDQSQPEYGDVQPNSLAVDETKRAADPEPDFEETKTNSPLDTEALQSPEVPLVVVEKVDDKPVYGDDFGRNATGDQKLAHKLRSADASPDRLIISSDESNELEPEDEDEQVPLFRHESFQDSKASLPELSMDAIEEESVQSSTDHTSSGDAMNTPSAESLDDSQENDELDQCPLLPHETDFRDKAGELKSMPLLSHETQHEAEEEDESTGGPLLSHETGSTLPARDADSDYEEDEYDAAPLLPHETGFMSYKVSEAAIRSSRLARDGDDDEPDHYSQYADDSDYAESYGELDLAPTFSHEQDLLAEDYGAPLLPHERGSAAESVSGSERSFSISPTTYESAYPAFGQEMGSAGEGFGSSMRPSFFRTRSSNSTLPNKLPRSDAEDLNLHDLGLEAFPIGRDQIFERVATIGRKLPEDETHDVPTSPQPSVLSQACSSVDLAPVKSYLSLASVREDSEEEDEGHNADVESLPSPVFMSQQNARFARDRDPLATPHPDDSKQLGFAPDEKSDTQSTHAAESSEADSVSKTDGARDSSKGMTSLSDIAASRATVMNTLTPPLTPRALEAVSGKERSSTAPESELRQRREPMKDSAESSPPSTHPGNEDQDFSSTDPRTVTSDEKLKPKSALQDWKRAR
ncbi:hypothetical protein N0V95_003463 [Ascochyta clinopodiicola]|nr:hypothetical protein N0V95_003463 [Ascochyta clinopodiicola]